MVDMSGIIWSEYEKANSRALTYEEREETRRAAAAHRRCAELLRRYAQHLTPIGRRRWLARAQEHLVRADRLESGAQPRAAAEGSVGESDYSNAVAGLIDRSTVTWEDIAGLEETKRAIKLAYGLSIARKPAGVRLQGWRRMLFYGPPGTGKTLLAAATSNGLAATFFNVAVSDLLSKYFGESSRLVSALFTEARARAPSVIFLDEVDALTPPRGSGESGAERRIISTLLAELDGLTTKDDPAYVLTIAATNTPWDIDGAILSRFEKKVHIPLPDAPARRRILALNLAGHALDVAVDSLVRQTAGYSGRDIARLCQEAIARMLDEANQNLGEAVDLGGQALTEYEVQVRPLSAGDFAAALAQVQPATTAQEAERYRQWAAAVER